MEGLGVKENLVKGREISKAGGRITWETKEPREKSNVDVDSGWVSEYREWPIDLAGRSAVST